MDYEIAVFRQKLIDIYNNSELPAYVCMLVTKDVLSLLEEQVNKNIIEQEKNVQKEIKTTIIKEEETNND